jgi:DNA-directed RNA polymerase specialized sigma24 family protein
MEGLSRPEPSVMAAVLFFVGPPSGYLGNRGEKGQSMRRVRRYTERGMLRVYGRIIDLYGPYVLVRCTRYTNRRRQSQQIGAYALISTCLAVTQLQRVEQLGRVVDMMMDVVAPDVVSCGEGEEWWGPSQELLLVDGRMRKLAAALNVLKPPWREVLVLHHLGRMEVEDLERLLQEPADAIVTRINRGERLLARRLGVARVRPWLARFAAGLDADWIQEVADCAIDFLSKQAGKGRG